MKDARSCRGLDQLLYLLYIVFYFYFYLGSGLHVMGIGRRAPYLNIYNFYFLFLQGLSCYLACMSRGLDCEFPTLSIIFILLFFIGSGLLPCVHVMGTGRRIP
jgi:hypothetical protein